MVAKHEAYTMFLNDDDYTDAETWMNEFMRDFISFWMLVNDYTDDTMEQEDVSEENKQENEKAQNLVSDEHGNQENTSAKSAEASAKHIVLKHEKPELPTFYCDIRKYFIYAAVPEILSQYYIPDLD